MPARKAKTAAELLAMHTPQVIAERLAGDHRAQYVSHAVLGGIDGCVTTFALVCGAYGAGFSASIALVLGLANLLADGFSMAVSNYQAEMAQAAHRQAVMSEERDHLDRIPQGEREEVRQIFAKKGFTGKTLDEIVHVITSDRELWLRTMLVEEHGLPAQEGSAVWAALATFAAFVVGGFLPLTPLFIAMPWQYMFICSAALAAICFFAVGALRSLAFSQPVWRSALGTLLTGSMAAGLAFLAGHLFRSL